MTSDWVKAAIIAFSYLTGIPLLAVLLRGRPTLQRIAIFFLCFSTIEGLFGPQNWSLTLGDVLQAPRSHTKGFHFFFNMIVAYGLTIALRLERRPTFRWLPPGLGLYLIYCGASLVSIVSAFDPVLVLMAAHKHLIVIGIFWAVYNFINSERDIIHIVRCFAFTIGWELAVCLKIKYVDRGYQISGTFEHQNSLGMYAVLIGMVFLAIALGAKTKPRSYAFLAFLASAAVVQATVSRGTMVALALGVVLVLGTALLRHRNWRAIAVAAGLSLVGSIGLVLTLDTIIARFNDQGNAASGQLREVMIDAARLMVSEHPLGVGWNNYSYAASTQHQYTKIFEDDIRRKGFTVYPGQQIAVIESHYYLLLSETGYQGLAAWLLVIGVSLWRNVRCYIRYSYSTLGLVNLGIAVGCSMNYLQSLLERVLNQPRNLMLWLILLAIGSRTEVLRRGEGRQPRGLMPPKQRG